MNNFAGIMKSLEILLVSANNPVPSWETTLVGVVRIFVAYFA